MKGYPKLSSKSLSNDRSLSNLSDKHLLAVKITKVLAQGDAIPTERGIFQHDSGAAVSIVTDVAFLDPESRQKVHKSFKTASGSEMISECKGLVNLITTVGNSFVSIPAYYVPASGSNLIAAADLDRLGYQQLFGGGKIQCTRKMKDHLSLQFLLDPSTKAYVFKGRAKFFQTKSVSLVSSPTHDWHAILGHSGKDMLSSMGQLYHDIECEPPTVCNTCAAPHLTRAGSRGKMVKTIGYAEGECVHIDLILYPTVSNWATPIHVCVCSGRLHN